MLGQYLHRSHRILDHTEENFPLEQAHGATLTIKLQIHRRATVEADAASIN
ncbi:hypothetical protein D3C77_697160 [compost metagenome]